MKKFLILLFIFSLLSFSVPKKSYAVYVDIPNAIKEYGLDGVASVVAKTLTKKLTAKTVNWINNGFKGNPGYITNPKQFFLDIGDNVASDFLSQSGVNQLCSPFSAQVRLALVKNYLGEDENYSCTLSILRDNYEAFTQDFTQGGWGGWFEVTQNAQNNPYGSYLATKNRLAIQIGTQKSQEQKELDLSGGILNLKKCPDGAEFVDPVSLRRICSVEEISVTPGTFINDQLKKSLGTGWAQLEAADELNEIVTALMTQLIEQVAGNAEGLLGASKPDPTKGNRSLATQIGDEPQPYVAYRITSTDPSINCTSTGGSGGGGGGGGDPDGGGEGGGGGTGGTARCVSTPGTVSGLPPWPLGGAGGTGGGCNAYTPNPAQDCTRVDSGVVLGILNNYPPTNDGITAAIGEIAGRYPGARILDHPVRLDKIDFGNGMVVDVVCGAGGDSPSWCWLVECACNRSPEASPNPTPQPPLPGAGTYNVSFTVIGPGLGSITDGVDTCSNFGLGFPSPCTKAFPIDSLQEVTATPAIGSVFVGWGGACVSFGASPVCKGNVTGNGAVTATFQ